MSLIRSIYQTIKPLNIKSIIMEDRQIRRRKKVILDILQKYIGEELRFSETIRATDIYERPVLFNVVRMEHFLDPISESFEEHTLSCKMLDGSNECFVRLSELSLEALLEIVKLITEDKATLHSTIGSTQMDELKATLQASGFLDGNVL